MSLFKKHIELVIAVNESETVIEHNDATMRLRGFRDCIEIMYDSATSGSMLMDCDHYYINKGIDRPMCCGVFLDWKTIKLK